MPFLLCVDDDQEQLKLYRLFFGLSGFEVVVASGGQEAVEVAQASRPDLILMDMMMPGKDGCQAAAEIKADPGLADIPIILVTAAQPHRLADQAAGIGIDLILSKTIPPQELLANIRILLRTYKPLA